MGNILRATTYKIRHSCIPCFLLIFSLACLCFALFFNVGCIVDVVTPNGIRIGFFPAGTMADIDSNTSAMATAQAINLLAWIGIIVALSVMFRRDMNSGAWKMAVSHGKGRMSYELADYLGQTIWLQAWYFLLSIIAFFSAGAMYSNISIPYIIGVIPYWFQNALLLQCFLSVGRVICILANSEIAFVTFGFLEIVIALIVAASNTKQNPSLLISIILNITPMPYWLELGACHMNLLKIMLLSIVTVVFSEGILLVYETRRELK